MIIMVNRKLLGIFLVSIIVLVVIFFGDAIAPTITSTPIQFDLSNPSSVNQGSSDMGRSCAIYPNDPGC